MKKILIETNIVIHREASNIVNSDIGQLFRWFDRLNYKKCIHPITIRELEKHKDSKIVKTMKVKLESYHKLKTEAPVDVRIKNIIKTGDKTPNDVNDSLFLNELLCGRVDCIITEDKDIHEKARKLQLEDDVYTIDQFLEKAIYENPQLIDYKVLSVKKEYFGNINVNDPFFDTFRKDYIGFNNWFNKKADEIAYICIYKRKLRAFLYLKDEGVNENYGDVNPILPPKRRLKIGTFKVDLNGLKISERLFKIVFDNALLKRVEEIYLTIFDNRPGQKLLIRLIEQFGFNLWGTKMTSTGEEKVYVRDFKRNADILNPKKTFPYLSRGGKVWFVSIYPEYHTELFPDSILRNEDSSRFEDSQPHRNAISKVYISHSYERNIQTGDVILFYRTGGIYKGVVTTLAIVESSCNTIRDEDHLVKLCHGRTVLTPDKITKFWNRFSDLKPFVVNFLYTYSLKKRLNLKKLIEIGVIEDVDRIPRGFGRISWSNLTKVIKESGSDQNIIGN